MYLQCVFVMEEREWSTWMDSIKASRSSTFSPMWPYSYVWRTLCNL